MSNAEIQQLNRLLIIQNAELLAELEETKNRLQERTEVSTFWYNKSQELEKSSIQVQKVYAGDLSAMAHDIIQNNEKRKNS